MVSTAQGISALPGGDTRPGTKEAPPQVSYTSEKAVPSACHSFKAQPACRQACSQPTRTLATGRRSSKRLQYQDVLVVGSQHSKR